MTKTELYKKLKSGTDIRGIAVETENGKVELTDEAVYDLTVGFCKWLFEKGAKKGDKISVGHDSRISAERIKEQVIKALCDCSFNVLDCSYASTPAMFMTTVDLGCFAAVQITASHHPFDRNGLKFFTRDGGLDGKDIESLIGFACDYSLEDDEKGKITEVDYMTDYAKRLREMIKKEVNAEDYEKPLSGYKIVVDAGNGVGGFYAGEVLAKLGADVSGSQFLDADGMFPNHIPNPENKAAMESVSAATVNSKADLGIIFDTDVDRAGCVDRDGEEINRNRLVALASYIAMEGKDGGVIVTDSVTSDGLKEYIESLGAEHYRFKRGYRNVINKQIELNNAGKFCPLAMETSGHAAFKENYYLDDGAYLMTKIVIYMAKNGGVESIQKILSTLKQPKEAAELRFNIKCEDFKDYGAKVLDELVDFFSGKDGWKIADDNRDGIRISADKDNGDGWLLLRQSVHDPVMPYNVESNFEGGAKEITAAFYEFIKDKELLDLSAIEKFLA